jgi:hypothetical protein
VPGPNDTELAIQIGYKIAGWLGLIAAGVVNPVAGVGPGNASAVGSRDAFQQGPPVLDVPQVGCADCWTHGIRQRLQKDHPRSLLLQMLFYLLQFPKSKFCASEIFVKEHMLYRLSPKSPPF